MGFTLRLKNLPSGAKTWTASYHFGQINAPELPVTQQWVNPYPANGETDMEVICFDASGVPVNPYWWNLGPVYDGKVYEVDMLTGLLTEVTAAGNIPWAWVSFGIGAGLLIGVAASKAAQRR